jgi:hypothetical protein
MIQVPEITGLINAGLIGIGVGLSFSKSVRYELLKRDRWTCQSGDCFGEYLSIGELNWGRGWNVNAAHYPDLHQRGEDRDMENGRCLCVTCHIVEEIERSNIAGAGLLYQSQTIKNKEWLGNNGWVDTKMGFDFYYDLSNADALGKQGLAMAFMERFPNFND